MFNHETIISNVIAGSLVLVLVYLFHRVWQAIRTAGPWLWQHVLKPWMGTRAKKYQDFVDSLVGNKTAQIQTAIGADIILAVSLIGGLILMVSGMALGAITDLFAESSLLDAFMLQALQNAHLLNMAIYSFGIFVAVLGSIACMGYLVALDMAKKKEREQEGNSDKTQTEVLDK